MAENDPENLESILNEKLDITVDTDPVQDNFWTKKVIIIGAGIAGLACANRLHEIGWENVTVLEARNRIGGRIHTVKKGSNTLELGAQWIHGVEDNVIHKFAKCYKLIKENTSSYINKVHRLQNCTEAEREAFTSIIDFLDKELYSRRIKCSPCTSTLSSLNNAFNRYVSDRHPRIVRLLQEFFEWYCKFLLELDGCQHLGLSSRNLHFNYKECEGEQHVELKGGYANLLDILFNIGSPDWVLKNKHVIEIDWSDFNSICEEMPPLDTKKIKVSCGDGDLFMADHVIITIPLGCLKENYQSLFHPPLSPKKEQAIESLGFGTVNKIYLTFAVPFWSENDVYIVLKRHLFDENLVRDSSFEAHLNPWTNSINRFSYTPGCPTILCAWCAGSGADDMESLPENIIIKDCMTILERIFGRSLPMPDEMLRSTWASDLFSLGSYCYMSLDCEANGVRPRTLAEPEYENSCSKHPVLMFAGEGTHNYYFSTVHGAYESGVREADLLYKHYCDNHIRSREDISKIETSLNIRSISSEMQIAIIGAGIAGLTCAMHLSNNNFNNIIIVDAQGQIGGRVLTVDDNGCSLELGAQWIHGTENLLYDFTKSHNLLPPILETAFEGKGVFYTSDGRSIEKSIVEEVGKVVYNAKAIIDSGKYDKDTSKSVMCFLNEAFDDYINHSLDKSNLSLKKDIFDWYVKFEIVDNACDDLNYVAMQSFTEWSDCPDEHYHINLRTNFKSITDCLLSKIPDVPLLLNTPVKTVKWNENFKYLNTDFEKCMPADYPIQLECNGRIINVDSVIVTPSMGFLQENLESFFMPHLPRNKITAFSKVGFGTVNKIYLIFEEPFWDPTDLGFHFVWKSDVPENHPSLSIQHPWIRGITGFDIVQKYPNVLLGWIGGNEARQMESVSEECVSKVCIEMLRRFLNKQDIPNPIKIFRSCWYSNEYIRGSYSNRKPNYYADENTLKDLQEPLYCSFSNNKKWPIVLFAGEATDENAFSSAHGAYKSGLKAAEDLIAARSNLEN